MENLHRSTQCRHFRIYVHTNLLLAQTLLAFNITYVCHTNWGKSAQDRNASFDSFPPCSAFLCPAHPLQGDFTVIIQHGPARTGSARASHGPPPAANRPVTGPPQARPDTRAPGPNAHPARQAGTHSAQARPHSTHRLRRLNTAPPQVVPDSPSQRHAQGSTPPRPG